MRLSQAAFLTQRENPGEAEIESHRLFLKAGFITKLAAGLYAYSPFMWRTIKKIAAIISDEMNKAGAQELMLPILQPQELWAASGRWDNYVQSGIMFHLKDRKGAELCLGPTHEEVITYYASRVVSSYKQLPIILYQQQTKFRDEIRPRFGLMRGREFIMKDAYSFDCDEAGLDVSYQKMAVAYKNIFKRCGLDFIVVQADSGAIGGSGSQEFMVTAKSGEDELLVCDKCGYAANVEKADSYLPPAADEPAKPMRREHTPNIKSVQQLCDFFNMSASQMVKTILYIATDKEKEYVAAVLMRGDLDINEVKLANTLGCIEARLADDETVKRVTKAEVGFAGPIGMDKSVRIIADESVRGMKNFLCGKNETDYHNLDVNYGRDFPAPEFFNLRLSKSGDACCVCKSPLRSIRGIEVGHIFKLGTKYSAKLNAVYLDQEGKQKPFVMGCYGIGTSRIAAAAIEQNFDKDGMIFPIAIAPYHAIIAQVKEEIPVVKETGEKLYKLLNDNGIETVLDDRHLSPGVKFKDADLVGIPIQIVVGKFAAEGFVEVRDRKTKTVKKISVDEVLPEIKSLYSSMMENCRID